ncbi:MAG: helix-hairpin-helix domain-containing protein [Syntrophomonadaceae bacterium]|jgi:competence protein ComEA
MGINTRGVEELPGYDKRIIAGIVVYTCLIFFTGVKYGSFQQQQESDTRINVIEELASQSLKAGESETQEDYIEVYVGGAVERPGVYRLPLGSRVYQAIEMAGGAFFLDPRYLDMARKLVDEETIFVPTREEIEAGIGSQLTLTYYGQADKLNINTASAQEIAANLSGIGPVLAERIVEYRNKNGSFKSIDEIKKVNGIGEGRFEEIKDHISVR